jgi:hypothetical protein
MAQRVTKTNMIFLVADGGICTDCDSSTVSLTPEEVQNILFKCLNSDLLEQRALLESPKVTCYSIMSQNAQLCDKFSTTQPITLNKISLESFGQCHQSPELLPNFHISRG